MFDERALLRIYIMLEALIEVKENIEHTSFFTTGDDFLFADRDESTLPPSPPLEKVGHDPSVLIQQQRLARSIGVVGGEHSLRHRDASKSPRRNSQGCGQCCLLTARVLAKTNFLYKAVAAMPPNVDNGQKPRRTRKSRAARRARRAQRDGTNATPPHASENPTESHQQA